MIALWWLIQRLCAKDVGDKEIDAIVHEIRSLNVGYWDQFPASMQRCATAVIAGNWRNAREDTIQVVLSLYNDALPDMGAK